MANRSVTGYVIRIGVIVLSAAMIWFMFGRPELYPVWTIGLIAAIGALGALSLVRYVSA